MLCLLMWINCNHLNAEEQLGNRSRVGFVGRRECPTQWNTLHPWHPHPRRLGIQLLWRNEETHQTRRTLQRHRHGTISHIQDTEFPGIIATRSEQDQRYYSEQECEYFLVKRNVEDTKMIQIYINKMFLNNIKHSKGKPEVKLSNKILSCFSFFINLNCESTEQEQKQNRTYYIYISKSTDKNLESLFKLNKKNNSSGKLNARNPIIPFPSNN